MANSISGFGIEWEAPISKKTARNLCGMYPMPGPGEEMVVAINADRFRLKVGNFSGKFVAFSSDIPRANWQARFGVTL